MSVSLKITIGTVNYNDFLHVAVAKVSDPTTVVWETWIDVPVTNYNLIVPDLDPENYYISYYDAPTNASLGTLVAQLIVNALTNQIEFERRFYTCGGAGANDPADGATSITDPYLVGKTVTGIFKEAFRFFEPLTEWTTDPLTGIVSVINGTSFSQGEKISIELKYSGDAQSSAAGNGLYSGTINVTEATRTLLSTEVESRVRLLGTSSKQVITMPALAGVATDKGFYFDNSVGGVAVQPKLLFPGTDKLRFNGFNDATGLFSEFWVGKGEHILIRKFDDNYWEVIGDINVSVGEKVTLGYNKHPNILVEEGQWIDGDEYGRLWWWLNNVLPATHRYTAVETDIIDLTRVGQFALHTTLKKFRMPYTIYMTERGLYKFLDGGSGDIERIVPYPGGWQNEQIGGHTHDDIYTDTGAHGSASSALSGIFQVLVNYALSGLGHGKITGSKTGQVTGYNNNENRVRNVAVIYGRRV